MLRDAAAGLAVAGVLLPEAVAYAAIAGVAPERAFVSALGGLLIYAALGSSRFAIVSPTSSAAVVYAAAAAAGGDALAQAMVIATGLLFVVAAAARASFLAAYNSRPVLRGFAWALAIMIVLKQLPHLLGIEVQAASTAALLRDLWRHAAQIHGASLTVGAVALAAWLALQHLATARRWPLPASLVVIAAGVLWAAAGGADASMARVGTLAWERPQPALPPSDLSEWLRAAQLAPALLLVLFAESWGAVRSLALQHGDRVDARREMLALGAANLFSGLFRGLPVGAGLSAASASEAGGSRSRLAGLFAAIALAALLWAGRGALAQLPQPVLAAVIIGILSHGLWPKTLFASLRTQREAWLGVVAAVGTLLLGAQFGMLLAVGLSIVLALKRFSTPLVVELGRLAGTRDYLELARHEGLEPLPPGLLVMRPEEPVFFANAEAILSRVRAHAQLHQARTLVLSLEMCDDLDATSVEVFGEFLAAMQAAGTKLLLARLKDRPRDALARGGNPLVLQALRERSYWSVDDAAQAAVAGR